ncbi:hypothetical protein CRG98_017338 [Punica granatum]|uniref:Uncharacterized protein n=1 Tax=Punica granatum TaxID=22663 RepID=A0A2I0K125_PUNGR|nr:hypothetical protein CRG98_017338 [Punica granatum]
MGSPIGGPDPESTGDPSRSAQLIRGRGRQSATLTPPPRSLASSVGVGALGGGFGVADWQPRPLSLSIFHYRTKMKQNRKLTI